MKDKTENEKKLRKYQLEIKDLTKKLEAKQKFYPTLPSTDKQIARKQIDQIKTDLLVAERNYNTFFNAVLKERVKS